MKKLLGLPTMLMFVLALSFTTTFAVLSSQPIHAQSHAVVAQEVAITEAKVETAQVEKSAEASFVAEDANDQAAIDSLPEVTNEQMFAHLMASIGGLKGASTLTIAYAVSQMILFILLSPLFSSLFPKLENDGYKLLAAVSVHLVVGVLGLMVKDGLNFGIAITHSTTLAMFGVFMNQLYKKVLARKAKA